MNFLWALALLIASFVIQSLITPRPSQPKAAAFEEFDFPQVDEGTPQAVIFGDVWTPDWIVLWYGNYRTSPIKASADKK